jgi:predicted ArsR family transcriptional regulator
MSRDGGARVAVAGELRNISGVKMLVGGPSRVARALLEGGPATARSLAARLGLTSTAVRRHLDTLEEEGYVEAGARAPFGPAPTRGRGRPARVYSLTASGRDAFDQAYDDLAVGALRYLDGIGGASAVRGFAETRAADIQRRYLEVLNSAADTESAADALARALTDDGYAAVVVPSAGGDQICQHHCPVAHVAAEFPQLCDAETKAFGRLLGTHVTRLATIAHGDGVCTTHVPAPPHRRHP